MKPHPIASFNVSAKKGDSQPTRWLVVQSIPFPDFECRGTTLEWRNGEDLIPPYGQKSKGIGQVFDCYLLPPGDAVPPDKFDRTHFAGFTPYRENVPTPGGIVFRGENLGETSIKINLANQLKYSPMKVRGFESTTAAEDKFLMEQCVAPLRQFITDNLVALKAKAIERITANMDERQAEAAESLLKCAAQAREAIANLMKP